jgi:D-alanyl-D-alanine carboxypeptidase/D-alanyl-D-alanine-endopeptidase (penicillin-binding protein 4)
VRAVAAPLVLAVAVAGCVVAAVRADADASARPRKVVHVTTPVLSARRVPEVIAAPVADRRLRTALDALVATTPGTTCVAVTVAGRPVYAAQGSTPLVPASLAKLLTAAVAVDVLGADSTLTTRVVTSTAPDDGVVDGDLWLVGGGDPVLATASYAARFRRQPQVHTELERLAQLVVDAGVREVRGGVMGDESRYDADRYPDSWPQRWVDQDQSGPLSALTVDDAWVTYPPNPDTRLPDEEPAADPAVHAATVLTRLLVERGVAVTGVPGSGTAPVGSTELAAVASPPVRELVAEMLAESDNQTAELLTKEIGLHEAGSGTTVAGVGVILHRLGDDDIVLEDGSGLAPDDRLTCDAVQALLDDVGPDSPVALGLPVAGRTGTLDERFVGAPAAGRLRAKTGTLNQVTALAGYVDSIQGVPLTFSWIENLPPSEVVDVDDLARQDDLAAILVGYPDGPALVDLEPKPLAAATGG